MNTYEFYDPTKKKIVKIPMETTVYDQLRTVCFTFQGLPMISEDLILNVRKQIKEAGRTWN